MTGDGATGTPGKHSRKKPPEEMGELEVIPGTWIDDKLLSAGSETCPAALVCINIYEEVA